MEFSNWKLDKIENIRFEEFFDLIENNRNRIIKTFPVTVSNCIDLKATGEFITKNIQIEIERTGYYFYVRNIETNNLIGYIGIKKIDYNISKCELFYFIDNHFEGKGIISKAVSEVIGFCFNELKMNKIFICTSKINFGSQQIALKNGFIHEGTLREEFKNHEGVLEDINYYGLLKSDYK
ncbi:GNAT family N-acetyltransferase [Flavobacterium sp.]|jgi:ribosomal-protein-serine acetyltransferase|uniref:GNAT family N-acetyltransferase n=1 Tax=Flavobacterium sp. TaxID=239 RepID=UPI00375334C5